MFQPFALYFHKEIGHLGSATGLVLLQRVHSPDLSLPAVDFFWQLSLLCCQHLQNCCCCCCLLWSGAVHCQGLHPRPAG
jgi:hypothetical protein